MRFYETVRPLETEIENLRRTQHLVESQLTANGQDLLQTQKVVSLIERRDQSIRVFIVTEELMCDGRMVSFLGIR